MQIFTETNRLILREILLSDEQYMFALDSDSDVHRYLGNSPVNSPAESRQIINNIRQQYIDNGIGRWAIIEKSTNNFLGWAGLKLITHNINGHSNFYDVGYRFIKKYWGNGYATEAGIAVVKYGFDVLNPDAIYGMADVNNTGSKNVLQKIGLHYINDFDINGIPHSWFEINNPNSR